jgi:rRNA-processing protein FCF1
MIRRCKAPASVWSARCAGVSLGPDEKAAEGVDERVKNAALLYEQAVYTGDTSLRQRLTASLMGQKPTWPSRAVG